MESLDQRWGNKLHSMNQMCEFSLFKFLKWFECKLIRHYINGNGKRNKHSMAWQRKR